MDDIIKTSIKKPLISVITPSFQQGPFIENCLMSVSDQDYENIEHIVFDAGSTDESISILEKWKDIHKKDFKFFIEKDTGQANALNKGFDIARGEIFCWLNADDYWLSNIVLTRIQQLLVTYNCDVVSGSGYMVDSDGKWIVPIGMQKKMYSLKRIKYRDEILQPATFWKKQVHHHLQEKYRYVFDWILFIEMFKNKACWFVIDEPWAAYRTHYMSKTFMDTAKRRKEISRVKLMNFGFFSFQYLWAKFLELLFVISEKLNLIFLKRLSNLLESIIYKITCGRL